jgi:hypothetical protein
MTIFKAEDGRMAIHHECNAFMILRRVRMQNGSGIAGSMRGERLYG